MTRRRNFGIIPRATRFENAARLSTAYLPPIEPDDRFSALKGAAVGVAIAAPPCALVVYAVQWWLS